MSSAPVHSTSTNRSNISQTNNKSSLPPKHPSRGVGGGGGDGGGGGHGRRNVQDMDQGDSLDRMMKKPNAIPGLESHYSKNDSRASQKPMGRNEYAEELRKQIEMKKEIDGQMDQRGARRSYSHDYSSSNSLPLGQSSGARGRHGGPQQSLHPEDYAESLRSQIAEKSHLRGREAADAYNPRSQIKAYSAPEPTRTGRRIVPAGGHSTFSLKWEG
jgi:hypothetical protein